MSAKGRGPHAGGALDVYRTPLQAVDRLLEAWTPPAVSDRVWLEPGAGDGRIARSVKAMHGGIWHLSECRATERANLAPIGMVTIGDFLADEPNPAWRGTDVVIGNPPYKHAEAFIRRACEVAPDAEVVFLLRLNFLASIERVPLWRDCGMPDVFVLPNRPSFTGDGKSDGCEYAWFAWGPGRKGIGRVTVLGLNPEAPRKRRGR